VARTRRTAISTLGQIRIESVAPQPEGYPKKTAAIEYVIWGNSQDTVWDGDWNISKYPRVGMEWKIKRMGCTPKQFSNHDVQWLSV
jgi:hypothetical protein